MKILKNKSKILKKQIEFQQKSEHTKNYFEIIKQLDFEDSKYDEKITARAGAIYELGKIAEKSKDHHLQIIKLLVNYVRENTLEYDTQNKVEVQKVKMDIIATLEVIGNRNEEWITEIENEESYTLNFSNLDFTRIQLPPNMNFVNISFLGVSLQNASLRDASLQRSNLQDANLSRRRP